MTACSSQYTFGPVPSRRLGKSLGINNIPAKVCSYACIYCQVGRTTEMQIDRRRFYEPDAIFRDVENRLAKTLETNQRIDYLTFVPDGEPTLDINLGQQIARLKTLNVPVGVITNSSLIGRSDVREDLARADWVSLKIDAAQDTAWRKINRPHKRLRRLAIQEGLLEFARTFKGCLVTETMLVSGYNDHDECTGVTADFISRLKPSVAYLSIPTRPPADKRVQTPDEARINRAYQLFAARGLQVEYLIGYEGNAFAYSGDVEQDILNITAVHPMRKEALSALLARAGAKWALIDRLVARGDLKVTEYDNHQYFLRRIKR